MQYEPVTQDKRTSFLDKQLNQKRQVKLKTCADVYNYWRSYKRSYKKAPEDGVELQVDYIDTGLALDEDRRSSAPIALALHGAPGSYHDFALLIQHLTQQNVRVIAPNFPEYTATIKTKVLFRHSADEKAAYLRDFLRAINVNKIDLLVSHSSAIFPTLLILLNANNEAIAARRQKLAAKQQVEGHLAAKVAECEISGADCDVNVASDNKTDKTVARRQRRKSKDEKKVKRSSDDVIVNFDQAIEIKAVALFNPAGHRMPKSMKPLWFKCGAVRLYQHKLGRPLVRKLGPPFLTVVGVPVRVDNMDNVMLSASVMRNGRSRRVAQQLEQLSKIKLPTLLVISENDKLIEKEIFYEMTQFMKLDSKNFDIFNNEGDIELSQSRSEDWIRVMVFKAGGHYAYSNYAKTVNMAVSELLNKVVKEPLGKVHDKQDPVASC